MQAPIASALSSCCATSFTERRKFCQLQAPSSRLAMCASKTSRSSSHCFRRSVAVLIGPSFGSDRGVEVSGSVVRSRVALVGGWCARGVLVLLATLAALLLGVELTKTSPKPNAVSSLSSPSSPSSTGWSTCLLCLTLDALSVEDVRENLLFDFLFFRLPVDADLEIVFFVADVDDLRVFPDPDPLLPRLELVLALPMLALRPIDSRDGRRDALRDEDADPGADDLSDLLPDIALRTLLVAAALGLALALCVLALVTVNFDPCLLPARGDETADSDSETGAGDVTLICSVSTEGVASLRVGGEEDTLSWCVSDS
eukprot:m.102223 g.102223  ORF g.102223 m.102223 type:complete len:314 (-) comp15499_c0_seq3:2267-3208(-)